MRHTLLLFVLVQALLPTKGWGQADSILHFRGAATEGANIRVFNSATGQLRRQAVPKGDTPDQCAEAAARAAWATGGNAHAQHVGAFLLVTKGIFTVTALGGCQYTFAEPPLPLSTLTKRVIAYANNSNSGPGADDVVDSKTITIPHDCRFLSRGYHITSANPNAPNSSQWSYNFSTARDANGVQAATVNVVAHPRASFGTSVWIGVELDVHYECER